MANDFVMAEDSGVGGGGVELSLELSIGGNYAKSKNLVATGRNAVDNLEETGRSSGESCEIQGLRRQEARKKRDGKLRKVNWKDSSGNGSGTSSGSGGVNIKNSRARVRGNEDGIMWRESKRGKNGNDKIGENQGSVPVVPTNGGMTWLDAIGWDKGMNGRCDFQPMIGRSFLPFQGNRAVGKERWTANASVWPVRSCSAFSDYQKLNALGDNGNSSDNGSNSSYSQEKLQQQKNVPAPIDPPQQSQYTSSSKHTELTQSVHSSADSRASLVPINEDLKSNTKIKNPTNQGSLKERPEADTSRLPRPQTEKSPENTIRPQMPCVSTTGNGPNGKTVMGFLYRYNKSEVCIVCVCHGSSFSPAEFVEHAGGVDITHPLRHITVIPSAFGQ